MKVGALHTPGLGFCCAPLTGPNGFAAVMLIQWEESGESSGLEHFLMAANPSLRRFAAFFVLVHA